MAGDPLPRIPQIPSRRNTVEIHGCSENLRNLGSVFELGYLGGRRLESGNNLEGGGPALGLMIQMGYMSSDF
jgi:hypothetical protein